MLTLIGCGCGFLVCLFWLLFHIVYLYSKKKKGTISMSIFWKYKVIPSFDSCSGLKKKKPDLTFRDSAYLHIFIFLYKSRLALRYSVFISYILSFSLSSRPTATQTHGIWVYFSLSCIDLKTRFLEWYEWQTRDSNTPMFWFSLSLSQ